MSASGITWGFGRIAEKRDHLYAPPDRSWSEERTRSEPFSIGRIAGDLIAVNLSFGPSGGQHQTIEVKCFLAKCLRSKKMKKIEAIISSSRLSALSAELRGDGILALLTTTRVQCDDHCDQRVLARKNKREALRGLVKIELIVADQRVQRTAQMILRHAQPGLNAQGGYIIILDLIQSLQIVPPLQFASSSLEEGFEASLAVSSSQKLSSRQPAIVLFIELISYLLFASILGHAFYALLITIQNRGSNGKRYEYDRRGVSSKWYSRNMGLLGTILLFFLIIHLRDFWYQLQFGHVPLEKDGQKDLYTLVVTVYQNGWYVLISGGPTYVGS